MHRSRTLKPRRVSKGVVPYVVVLFLIVIFACTTEAGKYGYERLALALMPSNERAYSYGDRHFSSSDHTAYNVDRAEYFFTAAKELNPKDPYAYHQLARIAFLRSDYGNARALITRAIELGGEQPIPSSYYVRGLIEGFTLDYDAAIDDYRIYIETDPTNWAATNDLAWVLLKAHRPQEALEAIDKVLPHWPMNPWLLNSKATAFHEMGKFEEALSVIREAHSAANGITSQQWLLAYPGNDPRVGDEGVQSMKQSIEENMHTIELASQKSAVQ